MNDLLRPDSTRWRDAHESHSLALQAGRARLDAGTAGSGQGLWQSLWILSQLSDDPGSDCERIERLIAAVPESASMVRTFAYLSRHRLKPFSRPEVQDMRFTHPHVAQMCWLDIAEDAELLSYWTDFAFPSGIGSDFITGEAFRRCALGKLDQGLLLQQLNLLAARCVAAGPRAAITAAEVAIACALWGRVLDAQGLMLAIRAAVYDICPTHAVIATAIDMAYLSPDRWRVLVKQPVWMFRFSCCADADILVNDLDVGADLPLVRRLVGQSSYGSRFREALMRWVAEQSPETLLDWGMRRDRIGYLSVLALGHHVSGTKRSEYLRAIEEWARPDGGWSRRILSATRRFLYAPAPIWPGPFPFDHRTLDLRRMDPLSSVMSI